MFRFCFCMLYIKKSETTPYNVMTPEVIWGIHGAELERRSRVCLVFMDLYLTSSLSAPRCVHVLKIRTRETKIHKCTHSYFCHRHTAPSSSHTLIVSLSDIFLPCSDLLRVWGVSSWRHKESRLWAAVKPTYVQNNIQYFWASYSTFKAHWAFLHVLYYWVLTCGSWVMWFCVETLHCWKDISVCAYLFT